MNQRIVVDPVTRIEGHLRIEAETNDQGEITRASSAGTMVTACANCRNVLEEGLEHYKMDTRMIGITELVAQHLKKDEPA